MLVTASPTQILGPIPPASLILGDSIIRNTRSKLAATFCFPGAMVQNTIQLDQSFYSHLGFVVVVVVAKAVINRWCVVEQTLWGMRVQHSTRTSLLTLSPLMLWHKASTIWGERGITISRLSMGNVSVVRQISFCQGSTRHFIAEQRSSHSPYCITGLFCFSTSLSSLSLINIFLTTYWYTWQHLPVMNP